jgi:hypothetical protein
MNGKGTQYFFESSARSVLGLVREGNEDSGFTSAKLIAVAEKNNVEVGIFRY